MTNKFAVVGDPITQSLSPTIHQAAYKFLGLDYRYSAHQVQSGRLRNFLESNGDFSGLSVTMPLKAEAFNICDVVDGVAEKTKVANTMAFRDGKCCGFNTDVFGIMKAVEGLQFDSVAVIGSGATARSAIVALQTLESRPKLQVFARNATALAELSESFSVEGSALDSFEPNFDLVINTVPALAITTSGITMSTSYAKDEVLTSKQISGKEMLLWQALGQLRTFINGSPDEVFSDETGLMQAMKLSLS